MNKNFCFAGASSQIAIETAKLLRQENNYVIGLSNKSKIEAYDEFHQVNNYNFGTFPKIENQLNGLVYFPGTINLKPFHRLSEKDFENDMQINAMGAAACIQAYLPNLKESASASVVLISTVAVQVGMPFHASIAMSKGAIEGLTRSLAAEFSPHIRVNCIAPSLLETPLGEKFINTLDKYEASVKRNPLKKIGKASDIANMVEFLLSEKSSWITGQILAVDGGINSIKLL